MRDIKFRARETGRSETYQVQRIDWVNVDDGPKMLVSYVEGENHFILRSDECELLEFTGEQLNGEDIYEADVLENEAGTKFTVTMFNGGWFAIMDGIDWKVAVPSRAFYDMKLVKP